MQQRYIRIRELATAPARGGKPGNSGMLPVSAATIWRWVKRGEFPPPVHLGPGTTAWPVADVERFLQNAQPFAPDVRSGSDAE